MYDICVPNNPACADDLGSGSDGESNSGLELRGFEGPEKRLQVDFFVNPARPSGLRVYGAVQWQAMLDLAKCTIISQTSNELCDSYVLSESSLFVYPTMVMLKTCGTTTLLHALSKLLEMAADADLTVKHVMFSRKNYVFPKEQHHPHNDWANEVTHLNRMFDGEAHVIGPLTGAHWYVYVADYSDSPPATDSQHEPPAARRSPRRIRKAQRADMSACGEAMTLEIMMHGLDHAVCRRFYRGHDTADKDKFPGVAELLPGSITDEFNFTPCGYSMNGLRGADYYTIHVTPEPHCSYASFETNAALSPAARAALVHNVLSLFQPASATVTLLAGKRVVRDSALPLKLGSGYRIKHRSRTDLDADFAVVALTLHSAHRMPSPPRRSRPGPSSPVLYSGGSVFALSSWRLPQPVASC